MQGSATTRFTSHAFDSLGLVSRALALLVLTVTACSSDSESTDKHGGQQDAATSVSRAEDPEPTPAGPGPAELPVPDQGFQLRSDGADIAAGEDVEYCEIHELPGEPSDSYYATTLELANAPFSHHLVVAAALPGSEADAALRKLNVGDRVPCNGSDIEWPQPGLVLLASAVTSHSSQSFPEGVGMVLHGKQRVVFDYHYLNTSERTVRAQSAFNVHVVPSARIQHIATAFSFFNFTIDIPAHATRTFMSECHFKDDLMVGSILRHTHEHGRDFSVWFSGGPNDGQHLWTSRDRELELGHSFAEPMPMKAGEGFRFECAFENSMDRRLRYGIKGTDEMCILAGWIWPASAEKELPPQSCGITWLDSEGVGHPVSEGDGFPPASRQDAAACLTGLRLVGLPGLDASCGDCICNSCGSILLKCVQDPDCAALVRCLGNGCTEADACVESCQQEIHDHSSAIGLLQQVQACLGSECGGCGPIAG